MQLVIDTSEAMTGFGADLARLTGGQGVIYFHGELGTGKTTCIRGLIQALGHKGAVKSPTFTIVEPYVFDKYRVYHFDLYRLGDPDELEMLGAREYFTPDSLCLVEWPECAHGALPAADLDIFLEHAGHARRVRLEAGTPRGQKWLANLNQP
jgi:tRNA threonylcarbamoyladenosine biosynthesis protein TsaE